MQQAQERLTASGLRVNSNAPLPDKSSVPVAASRTFFSPKGMVFMSQHLLVRHQETATPQEFKDFFDAGFAYGKSVNRVPLLRGMQFGYIVVPCIAVNKADEELIHFVSATPRQHWCILEFPVLLDLSTQQMHYYTRAAPWGAFFYADCRSLIEYVFQP